MLGMQEQKSIDFRRVILFQTKNNMSVEDRIEMNLIIQDIVNNIFEQIEEVIDIVVDEKLKRRGI